MRGNTRHDTCSCGTRGRLRSGDVLGQQDVVNVVRDVGFLRGSVVCGPIAVHDELVNLESADVLITKYATSLITFGINLDKRDVCWKLCGGTRLRRR